MRENPNGFPHRACGGAAGAAPIPVATQVSLKRPVKPSRRTAFRGLVHEEAAAAGGGCACLLAHRPGELATRAGSRPGHADLAAHRDRPRGASHLRSPGVARRIPRRAGGEPAPRSLARGGRVHRGRQHSCAADCRGPSRARRVQGRARPLARRRVHHRVRRAGGHDGQRNRGGVCPRAVWRRADRQLPVDLVGLVDWGCDGSAPCRAPAFQPAAHRAVAGCDAAQGLRARRAADRGRRPDLCAVREPPAPRVPRLSVDHVRGLAVQAARCSACRSHCLGHCDLGGGAGSRPLWNGNPDPEDDHPAGIQCLCRRHVTRACGVRRRTRAWR